MKNKGLLMAALSNLLYGKLPLDIDGTPIRERRSYKIRPVNYTHPMIVSSQGEIAEWNKAVDAKKDERQGRRNMRRYQQAV